MTKLLLTPAPPLTFGSVLHRKASQHGRKPSPKHGSPLAEHSVGGLIVAGLAVTMLTTSNVAARMVETVKRILSVSVENAIMLNHSIPRTGQESVHGEVYS